MTATSVQLTRTTPRYALRPTRNKKVVGICMEHGCDYTTAPFTTAGFISSIFAAHGKVLSDEPTPGVPVCSSVLKVEP